MNSCRRYNTVEYYIIYSFKIVLYIQATLRLYAAAYTRYIPDTAYYSISDSVVMQFQTFLKLKVKFFYLCTDKARRPAY